MIDRDQWLAERKRERLGIGDADEQRPSQPRPFSHGNRVKFSPREPGLGQRRAHHRHNIAQVFSRGELRHHAAVGRVRRNLRGHYV
jgi:hypothetical protein